MRTVSPTVEYIPFRKYAVLLGQKFGSCLKASGSCEGGYSIAIGYYLEVIFSEAYHT